MNKVFEFDIHIGDWRVLVQTNDIQNGAVQSRHITSDAVTTDKIGNGEVKSRNIADDAVTTDKIGDGEVKSRNIAKGAVTAEKIVDQSITGDNMPPGSIPNGKLANDAVQTRNIKNRNVTSPKINLNAILPEHIGPGTSEFVTQRMDQKYRLITDELYNMIASLQVGGIALSGKCGVRTDIGIHQKYLSEMLGLIWNEFARITGTDYFDFSLSVSPTFAYSESAVNFAVTADSTGTIGKFDYLRIYADEELIAEQYDVVSYTATHTVPPSTTTVFKAVGVIMGREVTKTVSVFNQVPFFIGSGNAYADIMNETCRRELVGTLEGDYDVTVNNTGEKIFIIIPITRRDEFRRADMNGIDIPSADHFGIEIPLLAPVVTDQYVVYESQNAYQAGTYNIDIDVNS